MMRFDIMTLFPDLVEYVLGESVIGRARQSGAISVFTHNIRDYSNKTIRDRSKRFRRKPFFSSLFIFSSLLADRKAQRLAYKTVQPETIILSGHEQPRSGKIPFFENPFTDSFAVAAFFVAAALIGAVLRYERLRNQREQEQIYTGNASAELEYRVRRPISAKEVSE